VHLDGWSTPHLKGDDRRRLRDTLRAAERTPTRSRAATPWHLRRMGVIWGGRDWAAEAERAATGGDPNLARWEATKRGPVVSYKASRQLDARDRESGSAGAEARPRRKPPTKAELAAPKCLCCYPQAVAGQPIPLRYGVTITLCDDHRDPGFLISRGGRAFLASVSTTFKSVGLEGQRYSRALASFVDDVRAMKQPTPRARPGSYAWPHLRTAAEAIWAVGGSYHAGEGAVLDLHAPFIDAVKPPSRQTVRRWWRERRWLTPRPGPPPKSRPKTELHDTRSVTVLDRETRHPDLAGHPYRAPGTPPDP
jgi:hypothetical protein